MALRNRYSLTVSSCSICILTQAITNNVSSLLFIFFFSFYGASLTQLGSIVTLNFVTQVIVDYFSGRFSDRIGYRAMFLVSSVSSVVSLVALSIMPLFAPFVVSSCIFAVFGGIGGGITEVLATAEIEALPLENRSLTLTLVHSSYSWGYVLLVLFTSAYLNVIPGDSWRFIPLALAALPLVNTFIILKAPILAFEGKNHSGESERAMLFRSPQFLVLVVAMVMSGACEHAMCQWASFFAQTGLGLSKTVSDILGPCSFALTMALSRTFGNRGKGGPSLRLIVSASGCLALFLGVVLMPMALGKLLCCALCGAAVGLMWPLVLDLGANLFPWGGTYMFGILALSGAAGCSIGPMVVGKLAENHGFELAFAVATLFPLSLLISVLSLSAKQNHA